MGALRHEEVDVAEAVPGIACLLHERSGHGRQAFPVHRVLAADVPRAATTHRVPEQEHRGTVDWVFIQHQLQDIDDVLLTELVGELAVGRDLSHELRRFLRLAEGGRQSQEVPVRSFVTQRRDQEVAVLLGKIHHLFVVLIQIRVFVAPRAVQEHRQGQARLPIPVGRNIDPVGLVRIGFREAVGSMLIALRLPLR